MKTLFGVHAQVSFVAPSSLRPLSLFLLLVLPYTVFPGPTTCLCSSSWSCSCPALKSGPCLCSCVWSCSCPALKSGPCLCSCPALKSGPCLSSFLALKSGPCLCSSVMSCYFLALRSGSCLVFSPLKSTGPSPFFFCTFLFSSVRP